MKSLPRACWYRTAPAGLFRSGTVHCFSPYSEGDGAEGNPVYPVGVVEDTETMNLHCVPVEFITFASIPNGPTA